VTQDAPLDLGKAWIGKTLKHDHLVTGGAASPDGRLAAAGSIDGRVHLYDLESEKETAALEGLSGWVLRVCFSPDGKRVWASDSWGGLACWEIEGAKPVWVRRDAHPEGIKALALSPDGAQLATGGAPGVVRVWDAAEGKPLRDLPGHALEVYAVAYPPDGKSLVTGDLLGKVRHWEGEKLVRMIDVPSLHARGEDFLADVGGVRAFAFDAEGKRLACAGLTEAKSNTFCPGLPCVAILDWESGKVLTTLKPKDGKVDGPADAVRFLPDGTLVVAAESLTFGVLWFWKTDAPEPFHAVQGQSVYTIDVLPDGRRLALSGFDPRGRGGNGRHSKRGEYVGNGGAVRILNLFAKPGPAKPPARK
jgi:WD40 repeat protein